MCEFDTAQTYSIALQLDTVLREEFLEFTYSLSSDVEMVSPFIDQLMRKINSLRVMDGTEVDIEVALREALLNAVIHGNREDPGKGFSSEYAAVQTEKSRWRFGTWMLASIAALCLTRLLRSTACPLTVAAFT